MRTVRRPVGVTAIAILQTIGAVLVIIGGVLLLALPAFLSTLGILAVTEIGAITLLGSFAGGILLIFGVLALVIAWGLWKGKNWARWITIVFCALGILGALGSVITGVSIGTGFGTLETSLFSLIVDALFIYILMRADAKAFFAGSSLRAYSPYVTAPAPGVALGPTYTPPAERPPFCVECGKPTTFIPQYKRYYCRSCKKYA